MTDTSHSHSPKAKHPTEVVSQEPLDRPASAETAARLVARLQLTEAEALALLDAPVVSHEEADQALHANLHAVAAALPPATVQALGTDPKLEVGREFATFPEAASRVGRIASAADKLAALHDAVIASAYVDAGMLQQLVWAVMPQLAARARGNREVQHTYASLFAYHHARNPGPRNAHARAPVDPSKAK